MLDLKQKKKIWGWFLSTAPLVIGVSLLVYNVFFNQDNTVVSLMLNVIIFILALLYIIFLPLGLVLIVSASRDPKFSISEVFNFGYKKLKENFVFFIGVSVVYYFVTFFPAILEKISSVVNNGNELLVVKVIFTIFWVLQFLVSIGLVKIALAVVDGNNSDIKIANLFLIFPRLLDFIIASLLYGLIVIGGFILFIIPGVIWQVKFHMFPYFIMEGSGPIEALKKSAKITNGAKADLFLLLILFGLLNLLGILFFFIGLFVTMPISVIGMAYVYRKLKTSSLDII